MATTRIGDVWDSTVDAARGRAGVIAPVAAIGFLLPAIVQAAVPLVAAPESATASLLAALVGLVTLVAALWAQLTIIGIATDPATTRAEASAAAWRRFLPVLGISLLLGLAFGVLILPFFVALGLSGIDFRAIAAAQGGAAPDLSGASSGAVLFAFFYLIAFVAVMIWLGTRLMLLTPVVLNERRGVGAIARSLRLTRGLIWKLIGVLLLYLVVLLIATFAVQAVAFLLVRLPFGEGGASAATLIGAVAGGIVTAVLSALFCVFTARLYVARAGVPDKGEPGAEPVSA